MTNDTTAKRGNMIAVAVWRWLQQQKCVKYVPWVLDPHSDTFDPVKSARQEVRDGLLTELEELMDAECIPARVAYPAPAWEAERKDADA